MEKEKLKFAPTVVLIDAVGLNRTGTDIARHFTPVVGRELPKADLAILLECMALDIGLQPDAHQVQVLFVFDGNEPRMDFCMPSHLENELNNVGFKSGLGEFSLYAFQPSGMATREELFTETLLLLGESKDVRRILLVPDTETYGNDWWKVANGLKEKESVTLFGMNPPQEETAFRFEMLGFSILQALGIRADEIR